MLVKVPPSWSLRESDITPEPTYRARRDFIKLAGVATSTAVGSVALPWLGASTAQGARAALGKYDTGEEPTPLRDIARYNNFYEFGTDKEDPSRYADALTTKPWTITVKGACEQPGTYDLDALLKGLSIEERIYRLRCVEAWSMVVPWQGFELGALLRRFQPTSKAKYVAFETLVRPSEMRGQRRQALGREILDWPYREGLRLDEAMHPLALMATGLYGKDLPNQNGAPLRLVVPWKYGFKSIKSIVSIRFTEREPETTWNMMQSREYGFYANVNPTVDHPRWSQKRERRIGEFLRRETLMFNGYASEVAGLYDGMNLAKNY